MGFLIIAAAAMKAKRAWVQKAKLRSDWAKQKRHLGLGRGRIGASGEKDKEENDQDVRTSSEDEDQLETPSQRRDQALYDSERFVDSRPTKRPRRLSPSRDRTSPLKPVEKASRNTSLSEEAKLQRERVRELTKQAYSKESLHTFKSDPLRRKRSGGSQMGNTDQKRLEGGSVKGRGQPNMKLRMNALLEKIKMDVGTT
ncbi:hypothetical protein FRC17_010565 [Serendipita sp. 399]|nr:hypothetical protein FRC17_010565 [Serendipita sp. 399]